MKKILACILAVALLTCVFAACGKTEDKGDSSSDLKLALVVAGTFGDRSFYDSSKEGVDRLAKDFGVQVSTIECNNENHATQMKNAADQADVVVCVGWEFYDVETIAPEYPNVKFIWIDNATSEPVANVLTAAQHLARQLRRYVEIQHEVRHGQAHVAVLEIIEPRKELLAVLLRLLRGLMDGV